ncbi:MAG: hypothetical protein ACXWT0_03240 [Methylobacter sp.]
MKNPTVYLNSAPSGCSIYQRELRYHSEIFTTNDLPWMQEVEHQQ